MAYIDPAVWRARTFHAEDPVIIRRVREPFGWLGNMSPFPVVHAGVRHRSTEHLFQCLRVEDPEVRRAIREESNPLKAKMLARKHADKRTVVCLSEDDLDLMRLCLKLKLEQHPAFQDRLRETGGRHIIEDCTSRPRGTGLFWGAALQGDVWSGMNWLGELWMEARASLGPPPEEEEDPITALFG